MEFLELFVFINLYKLPFFGLFLCISKSYQFFNLLDYHGILLHFSLLELITSTFTYYQGHFSLNFCLQEQQQEDCKVMWSPQVIALSSVDLLYVHEWKHSLLKMRTSNLAEPKVEMMGNTNAQMGQSLKTMMRAANATSTLWFPDSFVPAIASTLYQSQV